MAASAVSVSVSESAAIQSSGVGPAVLFPGRSRRVNGAGLQALANPDFGFAEFEELTSGVDEFASGGFEEFTSEGLEEYLCGSEAEVESLPAFEPAAPVRRAAPRGRRFEHGARPLSPTPSRPRASRPANRRSTILPSTQRAYPARVARSAPLKLRLTRRGQIVLLLVVAASVYAVFGLGRAGAVPAVSTPAAHQVVVEQGDSLWSIAARVLPQEDPRDVVGKIKSLNHLHGAVLEAGQTLQLP